MKWDAEVGTAVARWAPYYGVPLDTALVHAVIEKETLHGALPLVALEPDGDHSYGPMQVKAATARTVLGVSDPTTLEDPATGILYGTKYLAGLLRRFGGDYNAAIAAYNAGPGNAVRNAAGNFPNQSYVVAVLNYWNRYKRLLVAAAPAAGAAILAGVALVWILTRRRRATRRAA
jgi:soluble lytic murein transglycosylase-like protein